MKPTLTATDDRSKLQKRVWLTPARCRMLALAAIALNFAGHLLYLTINCPLDLAEDECYYWDWSRQLDISFYSKGPVTPYLIRASCAVFGDTMPAVRLPALLAGAGLLLCIWWLTRRLFGSDRLALAAVLLGLITPMIQAAGLIITTDPPFLFLWALATCLAVEAIFGGRRWAWPAIGIVVGLGFNTKFSMPLWLAGLFAFLLLDRESRKLLKTPRPWMVLVVFIPFTWPVLLWNSRHGWVTFRHVSEDVGAHENGRFVLGNAIDFWTGQMGVIGPVLFILILLAIGSAILWQVRTARDDHEHRERRAALFGLAIAMGVFVPVMLTSLRTHPAANWPAGSYVTLLVLTAHFLSRQTERRAVGSIWRVMTGVAIALGLLQVIAAHESEWLYPLVRGWNAQYPYRAVAIQKLDPTARLRGWAQIGAAVGRHYAALPPGSLIMSSDYQTTAELAFYVPGQPKTYCIGSYFTHAPREPFSQYDIWLDRRLDRELLDHTQLRGRDAIYVGAMNDDVRGAFVRVLFLEQVLVQRGSMEIRRVLVWRCEGFKGLPWPGWKGRYNK